MIPDYGDVAGLFEELRAYLRTQNVSRDVTCPYIAIYYDAEYLDRGVDAEAAAPVSRPLPDTPRTVIHELPGVETMACVIRQGGHDRLPEAHNTLMAWIEANRYRVVGPNRDIYLQGLEPEVETASTVTEVQFPVEKKPTLIFIQKEQADMEPKIVAKPAFTVVGMLYQGKNENNEIAQMWQQFNPRMGEVKHKADPYVCYGVCYDMDSEEGFEYVAGFEVDSVADMPKGMVSRDVPKQKYAIFPCTLKTIGEAYGHAFQTWLPGSGYQRGDGPDFEYYDENFNPGEAGSQLYIYIPIK
jgi:AraC family transcriptional regulator